MFDFLFKNKDAAPAELFYETDIHCHIMPGVDHGSPDEETSLRLIEAERKWGIRRIVLASHVTETVFENNPATLAAGFKRLQKAIADAGTEIRLAYSAEYRIDGLFKSQLDAGQLIAMPGNHLLVENGFIQEPWGLDELLFDLKMKDFKPIIAHPERYVYYHTDMHRYDRQHETGNLFQINLLSLSGYHGKDEKRVAEKLVEAGYADFLGSDIHHDNHVKAIDRYLRSKDFRRLRPMLEKTVKNDTLKF